ncbi:MAG: FAD-dependent monooxygenase [Proteobacteria bacterium]|nr:FAD-dependent monooxygenase [Pseudomonadota bacterium]
MSTDVDVVVAGGGVAGSTAAAALAALGWSVLIVEPGQHPERRLAGELIHPAGVAGLETLGLLGSDFQAAVRLHGFTVFPTACETGCIDLPYLSGADRPGVALSMDHSAIGKALLGATLAHPRVTLAQGWRVGGLNAPDDAPIVTLRRNAVTETVTCRLVVAADGAASAVRGYAGLHHRRIRNAVLTGYRVPAEALPRPGRGHVFTACAGPVLAYAISGEDARVLFNRRLDGTVREPHAPPTLDALPPVLRETVARAITAQSGLRFVSSDVRVSGISRGRVVLVGDAGGSCHPISASGMTMGITDAVHLGQAIAGCGGDIAQALTMYGRERRSRQRARVLLAAMLHEVLSGDATTMGSMRSAMHRYWLGSDRARAASMALLGMDDLRVGTILREFVHVGLAGSLSAFARFSLPMMRHVVGTMRVQ